MKTSLENYEASKKKLRIMSIQDDTNDSFMEADTWKELTQKYRMNKYNQPVNSIMLPKKTQIIQLQKKSMNCEIYRQIEYGSRVAESSRESQA